VIINEEATKAGTAGTAEETTGIAETVEETAGTTGTVETVEETVAHIVVVAVDVHFSKRKYAGSVLRT